MTLHIFSHVPRLDARTVLALGALFHFGCGTHRGLLEDTETSGSPAIDGSAGIAARSGGGRGGAGAGAFPRAGARAPRAGAGGAGGTRGRSQAGRGGSGGRAADGGETGEAENGGRGGSDEAAAGRGGAGSPAANGNSGRGGSAAGSSAGGAGAAATGTGGAGNGGTGAGAAGAIGSAAGTSSPAAGSGSGGAGSGSGEAGSGDAGSGDAGSGSGDAGSGSGEAGSGSGEAGSSEAGSGEAGSSAMASPVCASCGGCEQIIPINPDDSHSDDPINYPDRPPTSGPHKQCWSPWGVPGTPAPAELWVHNLEHGGIVYLYNCPDGCDADIATLTALVATQPRTLLTAYGFLPGRFAAVAWGHRLVVNCVDTEAFSEFYTANFDRAPESTDADPDPAICPTH